MPHNIIHRIAEKLPRTISQSLRKRALKYIDNKIWRVAREFKPDLILMTKAKSLDLSLLKNLRTIGKTINWYSETMDHWERIKQTAPNYDIFLNFDPYVVKKLHQEGHKNAYYLPFCADISKDAQWQEHPTKYNITFVGSFLAPRYSERETVLSQLKDLGLHIWGNKAWTKTSLSSYYKGWLPGYSDIEKIYRQSKIIINVHLPDVEGSGINFRPFEITAAGSLLLNHSGRKDIFNLFEAGKEFIPFDGKDDIREKVLYYLEHSEERLKIAKAGFERTRREHTFLDRAKTILELSLAKQG